jgi:hypothetical protein
MSVHLLRFSTEQSPGHRVEYGQMNEYGNQTVLEIKLEDDIKMDLN